MARNFMAKRNDLSDSLASSMDQVLNSEEHKNIFCKPMQKIKVAMATVEEVHPAQQVFDLLVSASEELDELGLSASAARTLQAAEDILAEMQRNAEHEVQDENDVMDLPSEDDTDEGVIDEHLEDENGNMLGINPNFPISSTPVDVENELVRVGPNHWIPRNELDPQFLATLDNGADLLRRLEVDPDQLSEEDLRSDEDTYDSPESKISDDLGPLDSYPFED